MYYGGLEDFANTAYPEGAVLTRDQVRELEEKSRAQLINQIETSSAAARLSPNIGGADQSATLQLIQQQQDQVLARLRSQPASGRLVIHISADINSWAGSPADIQVRSGDVLRIPKRPGFVLISGQVYNASAITYVPGKAANWYLQHAGGTTGIANRKEIFIIRANGSVVGRHSGEWYDSVLSTRLYPGDVVVVPQKIIGASLFWREFTHRCSAFVFHCHHCGCGRAYCRAAVAARKIAFGDPADRHFEVAVMETQSHDSTVKTVDAAMPAPPANWVVNATVLWNHRRTLARIAIVALIGSLIIACITPKRYESTARIMPPDNSSAGAAMFAALAGHALGELGGLSSLAGGLLGGRNTSALFVDLLRSGTISSHLIDRFQLQHAYHKRYRVDTAKYLAHHTTIVDDKRSGVITITVQDTDPRRARDLAQGYLDELNLLVNRTNTSSAHQERIFIERRLKKVEADLERAQLQMSEFASTHTTIDIQAQTRAMVDSAAKLQGEMIFGQSELESLQQIYGDNNIRVRAARARVAELQHELTKMSGTSAPLTVGDASPGKGNTSADNEDDQLYPPLRQLPRLPFPMPICIVAFACRKRYMSY